MKLRLHIFIIYSITTILASCSTVIFQNEGQIPFKISSSKGSDEVVVYEGKVEFYFWGLFPKINQVDLSEEFKESYLHNPSMVRYKRIYKPSSLFYTFLTLGIYMPEEFEITVYSKRGEVQ